MGVSATSQHSGTPLLGQSCSHVIPGQGRAGFCPVPRQNMSHFKHPECPGGGWGSTTLEHSREGTAVRSVTATATRDQTPERTE